MKPTYTYQGSSTMPAKLKLRLLFLTITLDTSFLEGERIMFRHLWPLFLFPSINAATWPLVIIYALQLVGVPIALTWGSWFGVLLLIGAVYSLVEAFAPKPTTP